MLAVHTFTVHVHVLVKVCCLHFCHGRNRDVLEDMLRGITMEKAKVKECMIWCMDHVESAEEASVSICVTNDSKN